MFQGGKKEDALLSYMSEILSDRVELLSDMSEILSDRVELLSDMSEILSDRVAILSDKNDILPFIYNNLIKLNFYWLC